MVGGVFFSKEYEANVFHLNFSFLFKNEGWGEIKEEKESLCFYEKRHIKNVLNRIIVSLESKYYGLTAHISFNFGWEELNVGKQTICYQRRNLNV